MFVINRHAVWAVALGALVVALATATVAGANSNKPYSLKLTGDLVANGSTVTPTVTGKFLNETAHQRLGSADLTAPSGYTVSSAKVSRGSATVADNVVELRNLHLMPGQSLTVTILLTSLTSSTCSASNWTPTAKEANNFNGPPGNDLTLDEAHSNLSTAVCSTPCPSNSTCNMDGSNSNGDANVAAIASMTTGQLFGSVNPSDLTPLTCQNPDGSDYLSADPNVYGVFSTAHRAKVVTITITNPVVSIPLKDQQVCFDAPYKFKTVTGKPAPDGNGGFIGLLPNCAGDSDSPAHPTVPSGGPCHDRDDDSIGISGSPVVLVVLIPSGLPGDPHMS